MNLASELPQPASEGPVTESAGRPRLASGLASWIVPLALAACALAVAAAHLPPMFKKLGLFAVGYGLIVGLIGAWLSRFASGLSGRRGLGTAAILLVALTGQIGIAAESYRIDRAERRRLERADPKQVLARRLLESANEPADPKSQATFDEFRRSYGGPGTSFVDYLQFRVSSVGIQSKPAAVLFWGVEVVLGSLAAGWVFFCGAGRASSDDEPLGG